MEKEITVEVIGIQKDSEGNRNTDRTVENGLYYFKDGIHYVITEKNKDNDSTRYKFNHRYLEVIKSGNIATALHFEVAKSHTASYKTPFGIMTLCFKTSGISMSEKPDEININVEYEIYTDNDKLSENRTEIHIKRRNA